MIFCRAVDTWHSLLLLPAESTESKGRVSNGGKPSTGKHHRCFIGLHTQCSLGGFLPGQSKRQMDSVLLYCADAERNVIKGLLVSVDTH